MTAAADGAASPLSGGQEAQFLPGEAEAPQHVAAPSAAWPTTPPWHRLPSLIAPLEIMARSPVRQPDPSKGDGHVPHSSSTVPRRHRRRGPRPARYGFISIGASEIELIQPLTGRSPYTEFLEANGEGVHHLAYAVESIEQYLAALRQAGEDPSVVFDGAIADRARFV